MNFQQRKQNQLNKKDKSNEQQVDQKIASLCNKINSKLNFYTTSSCAGRITITKNEKNKTENAFLFKSHNLIYFSELKKILNHISYKKLVYFKQEPCILHVACINLEKAKKMLELAGKSGWKRSGITSSGQRIVLELISTEKLELPIMNKGKLLISDNYLKLLIKEANKKLTKTWEKINLLEKLI